MSIAHTKQFKTIVLLFTCVLIFYAGIKITLYGILDVPTGNRYAVSQSYLESIGVPMTMMGDAYVLSKEKLPSDVIDFMESIASEEKWEKWYKSDDFNSIKFKVANDFELILEKIKPNDFLSLWAKTMKNSPKASFMGFIRLTQIVWNPFPRKADFLKVPHTMTRILSFDVNFISSLVYTLPVGFLFYSIGFFNIVFFITALVCCQTMGIRAFVLPISACSYNLLTMLMLCGNDWRFFFFNCLIVAPVCVALLKQ